MKIEDVEELQARIDRERLDAAQKEWERHARTTRVLAHSLRAGLAALGPSIPGEAFEFMMIVTEVAEILEEPMVSPVEMKARRELAAIRGAA